jgi:hypothetical protein
MANYFTRFLNQAALGALNPKGVMGNFQHATRLFLDDSYRLSPRTKFMYYVRFEIDPTAHNATLFTNRQHGTEIGYLVKTTDLPKFSIESTTKNQYNRKKIINTMINYEPITMTFHDDSAGISNALWAIYYGTYFRDRHNPTAAYNDLKYRATNITAFDNFRYGMDNNKTVDMFKSVSIYTMSRKRYLGYTLINPRIKSWNHGSLDYSASETLENTMTLEYEAVQYSSGNVTYDSPKGFATLHYDTVPSPLSIQGGGVANVFGEGGVLDGLEQIFGNVSDGTAFGSVGGFIGTAITAINTYRNAGNVNIGREIRDIVNNPTTLSGVVNRVGGLIGSAFPRNSNPADTTSANQRSVVGGS